MMPPGIFKKSKTGSLQNERQAFTGSKVQGFKPALVRRDVAMKLPSHFMELAFHHHILTCQVWARGCILIPRLHLGSVFTRKASTLSGLIQNLKPNWQLFGNMSIFNENFGSLIPSLSLTLNVEPLAQTGIKYECLLSKGRIGLRSPKCTKAVAPGQA